MSDERDPTPEEAAVEDRVHARVMQAIAEGAPYNSAALDGLRRTGKATSDRYMTPLGKARTLEQWEAVKAQFRALPPIGFTGGSGHPDPEMFDWCDRLNQLAHVCTLQSCAGHVCTPQSHCPLCAAVRDGHADGTHLWDGQLWLWFDQPMAQWFDAQAMALASSPYIERLSVHYHVDGMQITDVSFQGNGTGMLHVSMMTVLAFLQEGNRVCDLG